MIKKLVELLKTDGIAIKKEYIQNILRPVEGYYIVYKWKVKYFKLDLPNKSFTECYISINKKETIKWIKQNIELLKSGL